jgi:hypothetical protein
MAVDPNALSKLIRDSGVAFRENATSYVFECPRCMKKDKLAMYKASGFFVCYHCKADGFKGRPEFALTELLGRPLGDVRKVIYGSEAPPTMGYLDIHLDDLWGDNEDEALIAEPQVQAPQLEWAPDVVGMEKPMSFVKGARYLHSRGLRPEHVTTYDIRYSPAERRVLFPVKIDGKLAGWQGRYIGDTKTWIEDEQRYRTIPKIITSASLMGKGQRWLMFQDRLKGSEHCVLAEGPISALKAHKCGGNVASMGKAVSLFQLETIKRSVRKLYIALDPDAGVEIAKLAYDLYDDLEIYLLQPPQNFLNLDDPTNDKDLGDLTEDQVYEVFRRAKPEPRGRLYVSVGGVLAY